MLCGSAAMSTSPALSQNTRSAHHNHRFAIVAAWIVKPPDVTLEFSLAGYVTRGYISSTSAATPAASFADSA